MGAAGQQLPRACPLQPIGWLGPAYQWCSGSRRLLHRKAVSHVLHFDKLFKYYTFIVLFTLYHITVEKTFRTGGQLGEWLRSQRDF